MSEHHHLVPAQLILHERQRLVDSGHSQSLPAECLGLIPPIDLPKAIKAQLQEEGVLSPHEGCTVSTQLG